MKVELRPITTENWEKVAGLTLRESQKGFIYDNGYSIAESFFNKNTIIRAVYSGKEAVGLLMYEPLIDKGKPDEVEILRFMIDERHQGKGIGRKAFGVALEEIKVVKSPKKIHICFTKENTVANDLYTSFGFSYNGVDEYGQINLILKA